MNRGNHAPRAGAKFLATVTGVVYVGDGSGWNATAALARYEDAEAKFAGNHVFGHPSIGVGDVVGVHGGEVSLATEDADRAMVVSTSPIVTGNDPGQEAGTRDGHAKVAFVGQAPAKVGGTGDEGDVVVPSGEGDGTGRAVSPATYGPDDGPIVGRARETTDEVGITGVTVAVGLETGEALSSAVAAQQESVAEPRADVAAKADRIDELQGVIERKTGRIAELEVGAENKDERIDELERRLSAIEERTASLEAGEAAPASADD